MNYGGGNNTPGDRHRGCGDGNYPGRLGRNPGRFNGNQTCNQISNDRQHRHMNCNGPERRYGPYGNQVQPTGYPPGAFCPYPGYQHVLVGSLGYNGSNVVHNAGGVSVSVEYPYTTISSNAISQGFPDIDIRTIPPPPIINGFNPNTPGKYNFPPPNVVPPAVYNDLTNRQGGHSAWYGNQPTVPPPCSNSATYFYLPDNVRQALFEADRQFARLVNANMYRQAGVTPSVLEHICRCPCGKLNQDAQARIINMNTELEALLHFKAVLMFANVGLTTQVQTLQRELSNALMVTRSTTGSEHVGRGAGNEGEVAFDAPPDCTRNDGICGVVNNTNQFLQMTEWESVMVAGNEAESVTWKNTESVKEAAEAGKELATGDEAAAAENEAAAAGNEASPAGNEASPAGNEASPAGNAASLAGNEASPAGNEASPAGNEGSPAGNEPEASSLQNETPVSTARVKLQQVCMIDSTSSVIEGSWTTPSEDIRLGKSCACIDPDCTQFRCLYSVPGNPRSYFGEPSEIRPNCVVGPSYQDVYPNNMGDQNQGNVTADKKGNATADGGGEWKTAGKQKQQGERRRQDGAQGNGDRNQAARPPRFQNVGRLHESYNPRGQQVAPPTQGRWGKGNQANPTPTDRQQKVGNQNAGSQSQGDRVDSKHREGGQTHTYDCVPQTREPCESMQDDASDPGMGNAGDTPRVVGHRSNANCKDPVPQVSATCDDLGQSEAATNLNGPEQQRSANRNRPRRQGVANRSDSAQSGCTSHSDSGPQSLPEQLNEHKLSQTRDHGKDSDEYWDRDPAGDGHDEGGRSTRRGFRDGEQGETGDSPQENSKQRRGERGVRVTEHPPSRMAEIKEVEGDLFTAPEDYSLAHCVATDFRMGSGIAVTFSSKFKRVGELLDQRKPVGDVAWLKVDRRHVYYLVTKRFSNGKPTYDSLRQSLIKMRDHCVAVQVKNVAMPRIGCGLDRLAWNTVRRMIGEVFADSGVSITVYNYPQADEDADTASKQPRKCTMYVTHKKMDLVNIESKTGLLYVCSEDTREETRTMRTLDTHHRFSAQFRQANARCGDQVRVVCGNEVTYGLVVRKKTRDPLSYEHLVASLCKVRKVNEKDYFEYFGIEAFRDSDDDPDTMEKVLTCFKAVFGSLTYKTELWVCWPDEFQRDHVWEEVGRGEGSAREGKKW